MNKKFLVSATAAALVASAVVPAANAAGFKDVTADNGHKKAIETLAGLNIVSGYEDGTFKPNLQLKRSHVVKMLGKWLVNQGNTIPANYKTVQRFNDVPVNHKDEELVKYAALVNDMGVFTGNQNKLNGQDSMRRDQMALVLTRAIKTVYKQDIVKQAQDAKFASKITDLKGLTADKIAAIQALEYKKITNVTQYKPLNTMTRAQFATFLYNTLNAQNTTPPKPQPKPDDIKTVEVVDQRTLKVTLNNGSVNDIHLRSDLPANKEVTIPIVVQGKDYQVTVTYVPKTQAFQVASIKQTSVTEVEVTFSKPLKKEMLSNKSIQVRNTDGYEKEALDNVELMNENQTLKITTKNPLKHNVKYAVYAEDMVSYDGLKIGKVNAEFTGIKDDGRPRIAGWENKGSNTLAVNFTKPIQDVKGANYRLVDGTVVTGVTMGKLDASGKFLMFDFSKAKANGQSLGLGTPVIIQLTGAIDKAGNTMAVEDTKIQIKTRQPDGVKPTLAKAEQLLPKTIKLTFSEPILRAGSDKVEIISDGKPVGFAYQEDKDDPRVYYYVLNQAVGGEVIIRTKAKQTVVDYTGEINTFEKKLNLAYDATPPKIINYKVVKKDGNEYLEIKLDSEVHGIERGGASFEGTVEKEDGTKVNVASNTALLQRTNEDNVYLISLAKLFDKNDYPNATYQGVVKVTDVKNKFDIPIKDEPMTIKRNKDEVNSKYQIKLTSDTTAIETSKNSPSTVLNNSYIRIKFDAPVDATTVIPENFSLYRGEVDKVVVDSASDYIVKVYFKPNTVKEGSNELTIKGIKANGSNVEMEKVVEKLQLNAYTEEVVLPEEQKSTVQVTGSVVSDSEVKLTFTQAVSVDALKDANFIIANKNTKFIAKPVVGEEEVTEVIIVTDSTLAKLVSGKADVTFTIENLKDKQGKFIQAKSKSVEK